MPTWTIFEISFLWKHQSLCFHYWDYLTNFWRNNSRSIIDIVERLCLRDEQIFYLKMWIAIPFRSLGSPAPAIVLKPWTKLTDVFLSGKSKGFHLSWLGLGCCSFQSWLRWSQYALKFLSCEMKHVTQLTWTDSFFRPVHVFSKQFEPWKLTVRFNRHSYFLLMKFASNFYH